jgi:DNA primase
VLALRGVRIRPGRKIRCLFDDHDDNDPSFTVYDGGKRFHCFGCGRGGDAIDLEALLSNRSVEEVIRDR